MKSLVCADANIAIKRLVYEPDSVLARALWAEWETQSAIVIAPTLWAYEVTSVLRKLVHQGRLSPELEQRTLTTAYHLPVSLRRPSGLHQHASNLARRFNRPTAYDAHYLALAEMVGCPFWTSDERLFNAVHGELPWVHWLGHFRKPEVLHEKQADYRAGRR
jgi:predicted nucleic acid-binding protein